MKTSDWPSILDAKALLVGENSTLQWNDEIIEFVMFLDYYFNHKPYDLGERSRYSEAKTVFDYLKEITAGECRAEEVYGTLLCKNTLNRPPRGKHIFIPENEAKDGMLHIKKLLTDNPSIRYVFVMGLQANYYLQKLGLYDCGELTERFLKGAEPRRDGVSAYNPFYQPVNAKPFRELCFNIYDVNELEGVKIIPILPVKNYPLSWADLNNFGGNFEKLKLNLNQNSAL